jgi:hypothetical protein
MLICAYLMNDKDEVARRKKEVEQLLKSEGGGLKADSMVQGDDSLTMTHSPLTMNPLPSALSPLPSALACYLALSLFIVTHDPKLRKEVKAWRQSHPDCPLVIRRFLSIAKQIRC